MVSRREQILAFVVNAARADSSIPATVYRSRVTATARAEGNVVIIEPAQDVVQSTTICCTNWLMLIHVTVIVRGAEPDVMIDSLVCALHRVIMADTSCAGLASDITPQRTSWQIIDADQPACVVTMDFAITYQTIMSDITEI
mgnify:FL=1